MNFFKNQDMSKLSRGFDHVVKLDFTNEDNKIKLPEELSRSLRRLLDVTKQNMKCEDQLSMLELLHELSECNMRDILNT